MTATVRGVSPQPRGIVPPAAAERYKAAKAAYDAAEAELHEAVAAALKSGGSIREVMALTGMSNQTVQRWGREGGWPTKKQAEDRECARRRAQAHREAIAEADRKLAAGEL